jgi:predicted aspartyl protease
MIPNSVQEAAAMGRVTVDVKLANNRDVVLHETGMVPAEQVRRLTIQGTVDPGASMLVLPSAVADQLGLPRTRKMTVTYGDRRTAERDLVNQVEVELLGRKSIFDAILEPARTTVLVGAIVLEALDLLVDCRNQQLIPRDPAGMTAEIE